MRNKILVTGGTGTVGGQVVAQLLAADADVRVLTRSPSSAKLPSRVEVLGEDLSDPATVAPVLTGVDAVFLLWPFAAADRAPDIVDLIAERARRVVYLSSAAVRDNERRIEELLEKSSLEWTFLRPNVFAPNAVGRTDPRRRRRAGTLWIRSDATDPRARHRRRGSARSQPGTGMPEPSTT
jgi:uncharacterized protein YbjT (DUF2867 family)